MNTLIYFWTNDQIHDNIHMGRLITLIFLSENKRGPSIYLYKYLSYDSSLRNL